MANKKITALPALGATPATDDVLPIVDVSGTATTKKVTVANLVAAAPQGDLLASNNLSDVANAGTSRTNLGLGTAAVANTGTSNGNVVVLDAVGLPAINGSQLTNLPAGSVEGTAVLSTGETGATKFLREDGDGTCSFNNIVVGDAELRGTANPHIGAYPNQSIKVLDSQPPGSALMVADSTGLKFAVGASANVFVIKGTGTASRLAEASELPSFSISKDSGEPDIELTDSDGEVYSVVNGDSDTLGANGLPIRQGYQLPNIGANPSPLLISGGTIS